MPKKSLIGKSNKKTSEKGLISYMDWSLFIIIGLFCFVSFQQADILHTGASSFAYINGHFSDFYDYNLQYVNVNNYLPMTYILFAIWNLPLKLLGIITIPTLTVPFLAVMWYKLLPTLFYMGCGYTLYRIAGVMGFNKSNSQKAAFIFLTTPIGFFSQFIFGQYDSFTVLFVLIGFLYYLKNDHFKFILFFGLAIPFKYTAILVFAPLLLLKEKNIPRIIISFVCVVIPTLLNILPYIQYQSFRDGVFGFGAFKYIFDASFKIGNGTVSVVIVSFIALSAWAYFLEPKDYETTVKLSLFLCNAVMFLLFGLTLFHPQWLLLAAPFIVLSTMMSEKPDVFLWLDMLMMVAFTAYTVNNWPKHVDQAMLGRGIFESFAKNINNTIIMRDLFIMKDLSLWYSILSACFLITLIFKTPRFSISGFKSNVDKFWNLVRVRFILGVSIFLIPAFACLLISNYIS